MQIFETWSGPDFLVFYAVMLVACIGLSLWIPHSLKPQGGKARVEDPEEIALLAGGAQRHALAILAGLYAQGAIARSLNVKANVARTGIQTSTAGEAILRQVGAFSLKEAMRTLRDHVGPIETRLKQRGLLMETGDSIKLRLFSIAPYAALFVLGLYRWQAGDALGEPTGFLLILLVVTALFMLIRLAKGHSRTRSGDEALSDWRKRASRLKRAPEGDEVSLAVGLFGTGVLVGTPYVHVHAMRQFASGHDSSGSKKDGAGYDGGGCGGGGCGGGCGGCGG